MKLISLARAMAPLGLFGLSMVARANTYTVTTTNANDPAGFLQALTNANNHPGPDTIDFNIPGPGPHTITLITGNSSVFVLDPVTIDGTTQPGYAGVPDIEFRGSTSTAIQSNKFLQIAADDVVVKGISVSGYSAGFFDLLRNHFQVYSCYLGIRPDGTVGLPAAGFAVSGQGNALGNTVVGAPGQGNYIGGCTNFAVVLQSGANHRVQGNVFGTDITGVPKLDNFRGVAFVSACTDSVVGGNGPGEGNKFPCIQNYAISLGGSRNKAAGNWIGLDVTGTAVSTPAVGGTETYGILSQAGTDNQIGDVGENGRNIINGKSVCIRVMGSTRLKIFNNWCGFNKNGTPLGQSLMSGVFMTAPGGNNTPATSNVSPIIGGEPDWPNVFGQGGGSVTTEVSISAATGAKISSNWFGIAPDGVTTAIMAAGISMNQTVDTVVGGLTFGERNVFGLGASDSIISILDTRPVFQGNYIGMNAFGTQVLNHTSGISCTGSIAPVIGGPAAGAGNYIAGGTQKGIVLGTTANPVNDGLIQGNFIGFLPDGTKVATGDSSAVVISGLRNRITQNAMYSPNVIGIDLGDNNRNGNDLNDPDTGPNNLQNYPALASAGKIGSGVRITGSLNSAANSFYTFDFYASTAVGTQSMGERYLGSSSITTNPSGNATFIVDLPSAVAIGERITATATDASGNTSELSLFVAVTNLNLAPTAKAGPDQVLSIPHDGDPSTNTSTFTLDGSASSDPNGDVLEYAWREGNPTLGRSATLTLTRPAGFYNFNLLVSDPFGLANSDDVTVTINAEPNAAPTADAGANQTTAVPHDGNPATNTASVTLNGTKSDPDGDTISGGWKDSNGNSVGPADSVTVSLAPGTHTFTYTVTDSYGASSTDTVTVTVDPEGNSPTELQAGGVAKVVPHDGSPATNTVTVQASAVATDLDGDPVSFEWRDSSNTVVGTSKDLSVTLTAGSYAYTVTAKDPYGAGDSRTVTVIVYPEANDPPNAIGGDQFAAVPHDGDPNTNTVSVTIHGSVSDPEGDATTLQWTLQGQPVGSTADIMVDLAPGDHVFILTVKDAYGAQASATKYVHVSAETNGAPQVTVTDTTATVAHDGDPATDTAPVAVTATVSDPDGDTLTYEWRDENGVVLASTLSFTAAAPAGVHTFTLTATDPYGQTGSSRMTVTVNDEANASPTVNAGDDQSLTIPHDGNPATNAVPIALSATGTDPDGDGLTYEWYEGATLRGNTAVLAFACTAGDRTFTVKVRDAYGKEATDTVSVHVDAEPNGTPVADPGQDRTIRTEAGQSTATFELDASGSSDPDGDELRYGWTGNVQLSQVKKQSLTLAPGTHTFTLTVTDPYGAFSTKSVTITVELGNQPPVSVAGSNQTVTIQHDGDPATSTAGVTLNGGASTDADGQALTYEWKDGNGNVVGTTASVSLSLPQGSHTFTLKVTDPFGASNSSSVQVTVLPEPNGGPSVDGGADKTLAANAAGTAAFSLTATSSDPDGDTLSVKWYEGATLLGSGPSLSATLGAGIHALTVVAADPYGVSSSDTVVVNVWYAWGGFLQPINNDNSSIFKQGSTVPVKFDLVGVSAGAHPTARLYIAKVTNDIMGTEMEPISTVAADSGNVFNYTNGHYQFNMSTKSLTAGTYRLRVDLGDGNPGLTVLISLKP